jgi:uncharacterized protein involved in exopolysaccharide biosynthesis
MSEIQNETTYSSKAVLKILLQYRRFILTFVAASMVLIGLYGFIMPQTFSAEASLMPPEQRSGGGGLSAMLQNAMGGFGLQSQGPSSQVFGEILQTRSVAEFVVDSLKLAQRPLFKNTAGTQLAEMVQSMLLVEVKRTGVISVATSVKTGFLPSEEEKKSAAKLSAEITNAAIAGLDYLNNSKSVSTARKTREYIERVQERNRLKLDSIQTALQRFQTENKVLALDEQTQAVVTSAGVIGADLAKAEIELQLARQEMQPGTPALRQMEQQVAALRSQFERAQSGGATGSDRFSIPLQRLPELGREYFNLTRDLKILEQVNLYLETQRMQEAIQEARDVPTVQVLDPAKPPLKRSAPSRVLMLLLTAVLSPLIAIMIVFGHFFYKSAKAQTA